MPRTFDQAAETLQAARRWAKGRCYAADYDGVYDPDRSAVRSSAQGTVSRRVSRTRTEDH